MKKKFTLSVLICIFSLNYLNAQSDVVPKAGATCPKLNLVKNYQDLRYECSRIGKLLKWKIISTGKQTKNAQFPKEQVIQSNLPESLTRDLSPISFSIISSSGLRVQVISETPLTCSIKVARLVLNSNGKCILNAKQPGNSLFMPVEKRIEVSILAKIIPLDAPANKALPKSAFPSTITQTNPSFSMTPELTVLPVGKVGERYSIIFKANGGSHPPYFIKPAPTLMPPGLEMNIVTGEFSGIPTKPGTYKFTLGAFDTDYTNPNASSEYNIGKYVNNAYANYELTITGTDNPSIPWFAHNWRNTDLSNPYPIDSNFQRYGGQLSLVTIDGVPAVGLTAVGNSGFNAGGFLGTQVSRATQAYVGVNKRLYSGRSDWKDDEGLETWTRSKVFFPANYVPSGLFNGEWNWIEVWHTDDYTQRLNGSSIALGIFSSKWDSEYRGTAPRFVLRLLGGDIENKKTDTSSCSTREGDFKYEHWYDVVIHMIWSSDPNVGKAELWIDNYRVCSVNFPTLYTLPNGIKSWNNGFGLYNYRPQHEWSTTIYFGEFALGPTAQSVDFKTS